MAFDFWDTSAAAKLYLNEPGSSWALSRIATGTSALSAITLAEMASLLARRCAEGEFDSSARDTLYVRFLEDRALFQLIAVSEDLLQRASGLLLSGLFGTRVRASDAIQVVTSQWWFERARERNIEPGAFIVADRPLRGES